MDPAKDRRAGNFFLIFGAAAALGFILHTAATARARRAAAAARCG